MNHFKDRLQIAIGDYSVNAFAKKSGITEGSLRTYLTGTSLPGLDKLISISEAAEVNIEWLATGKGPKTNDDHERFNFKLLTLIIEGLDDYETAIEKKQTALERSNIISYAYDLCYDYDLEDKQTKALIADTIKGVEDLFATIDRLIKTETGKEKAIKILSKAFGHILPKDEAEFEAEEFIYARLLKRRRDIQKPDKITIKK